MIQVAGKQFRTLDDEFFANGKKVIAAYANGSLVYPECAYLGRQNAKVENINYEGHYVNEVGEHIVDYGTYSIYADMIFYSDIPLTVVPNTDYLNYYGTRIRNGQKGTIRLAITATANCNIPQEMNCSVNPNVHPLTPYEKWYDPKYNLKNFSMVSYVFAEVVGDLPKAKIVYTFDEWWSPQDQYIDADYGHPILKDGYVTSSLDFRFITSECKKRQVKDYHGHYDDPSYWEFEEVDGLMLVENYYNQKPGHSDDIHHILNFHNATVEQVQNG